MDLRIIIPVKPFNEAKQRLAPKLGPVARAELAERMFRHVFGIASGRFGAQSVLVVSRSCDALAIAQSGGGFAVLEHAPSDLNAALSQAASFAQLRGNARLLVVASDLPQLDEDDLTEMAEHDCAIAPDRHERGTNALLWPSHLSFAFGDGSLARHLAIANEARIVPQVVRRPGLAHDVDVPGDLKMYDSLFPGRED